MGQKSVNMNFWKEHVTSSLHQILKLLYVVRLAKTKKFSDPFLCIITVRRT